ncbi:hypothetical protein HEK616_48080 [Streptomyces nigrescens]|uniref:Uncharacterized protein n=1 Tax=Streptomyces nigrescens TaxID=1920 RepID=A0ABM7ZY91_STRNI|nr:hypothetical protein HEK616_48080 [Streptomyces nigrescens]
MGEAGGVGSRVAASGCVWLRVAAAQRVALHRDELVQVGAWAEWVRRGKLRGLGGTGAGLAASGCGGSGWGESGVSRGELGSGEEWRGGEGRGRGTGGVKDGRVVGRR